ERACNGILVSLKDIGRRLDVVGGDLESIRQALQRGSDGLAAAEVARHAGQRHIAVRDRQLAVLELADLIDQEQRGSVETGRRAARKVHLIDDLDATKTCA